MSSGVLSSFLRDAPLVAVLRGIEPDDVEAVGDVLVHAGFRILEVPLNSPAPIDSVARLAARFPDCLIGAGTVVTVDQVGAVRDAGGRLIVSPHLDVAVVDEAVAQGLCVLPGIVTPTEAFKALEHAPSGLKLFPGELVGPAVVKALRAVLPRDTLLIPTGGVNADSIANYWDAGVSGFGTGSALYAPGMDLQRVARNARALIGACRALPLRD